VGRRLEDNVKLLVQSTLAALLVTLLVPTRADAMCGFIAPRKPPNTQRSARIVNESSKVAMARTGDLTTITMANDVKGDVREFALVIPVPTKITKDMIKVVSPEIFDQVEALTAPRVVETQDKNPCARPDPMMPTVAAAAPEADSAKSTRSKPRASDFGVKVEAHYQVGEYDIAILSAKESDGLIKWLNIFKYDIPQDAADVLTSYIRQGMKFFVTRVNLKKHLKEDYSFLRPLQISYKSPKLMLPIRLGMLNADGKQELHLFTVTDRGRVETTNYRTVKMHTGLQLPVFAIDELSDIYARAFRYQTDLEGNKVVFQEFAGVPVIENWRQPWEQRPVDLAPLGASWVKQGKQAFVTRLHFRYDQKNFPEDLMLQVTDDMSAFSIRFPTRRPWRPAPGEEVCNAGERYLEALPARFEKEAKTLAEFTGMDRQAIRKRLGLEGPVPAKLPKPPPPPSDVAVVAEQLCGCSSTDTEERAAAAGMLAALALLGLTLRRRRD
jgi:MYXO-CTERM domain-containing protein